MGHAPQSQLYESPRQRCVAHSYQWLFLCGHNGNGSCNVPRHVLGKLLILSLVCLAACCVACICARSAECNPCCPCLCEVSKDRCSYNMGPDEDKACDQDGDGRINSDGKPMERRKPSWTAKTAQLPLSTHCFWISVLNVKA